MKKAVIVLIALIMTISFPRRTLASGLTQADGGKGYIKWFEFNPTSAAMSKALELYLTERETGMALELYLTERETGMAPESDWDWISLLAYLGAKYGGSFKRYKEADLTALVSRLKSGERMEDIAEGLKYYDFYHEAYRAVLDNFVGVYMAEQPLPEGQGTEWVWRFGLKAFSPIAGGYYYSHTDDFGNARDFGYKRTHQGHDLMGSVGTPVVAVESGVVETLGWNYYGGWRIGIRSFDGKRYYYYAHLRKDKPYTSELSEGLAVKAGDVIGYLGQTGYSRRVNYNGIKPAHLHIGLQIIFDESQKDSNNELWIDMYELTRFLQRNKSAVRKDSLTGDYRRVYDFFEPDTLQ